MPVHPLYDMETQNGESIEEIRNKLKGMRKMMEDRQSGTSYGGGKRQNASIIDGSFLSAVFGIALLVIITVSVYAFYNLTTAILKKFPHSHEEL